MDPGGKRHVMLGEDDLRVFGLLQTNTKALLYQATSVCSATKTKLVRDYAEAIRKYANANKTSTGIRDQEFPESRQRTIVQQAIPRSIHRRSQSALLTIVYEVGMTHFHQNLDYFLTPGRGPNAAANTLAHFSAWEATGEFSESLDSDIITQLVQDHCLPFLDVFPWPRVSSSDTQSALELLRRGIHAVDPLVILTLGGETSKMALADFGHTYQARSRYHYDRSRPGALHRPGTIHLRNFDALPDRKQDCDWAVIVLSNDPGSLYYSAHVRPAATRLFCLTTAIPNLLCCFLTPEKQENSKILDDKEVLCNAWKSLYQWIMRKKSRFSIETAIEDLSSFAQIEITEDDGPSEPSNRYRVILTPEEVDSTTLMTRTSLAGKMNSAVAISSTTLLSPEMLYPRTLTMSGILSSRPAELTSAIPSATLWV
ncbi:uncharacterized protein TRUGW13939_11655 [Talaromyces rugulosus]|uniref:Uncharacterized protein n=1 Tax=Talaromyces rugulosus TaxID=121627 RepID=A0A7H8RFI9_TALRU|nr:uncharacterized protein TRUGW13939_11655 [Talaromyces rugulosus]QKX64481.1 hypothetical protein TRUGW13939_11655 [Talaromyces rugulosus]